MKCTYIIIMAHLLVLNAYGEIEAAVEGEESAAQTGIESVLRNEYNLAEERTPEPRYYYMETKVVYFEEDGTRKPPITLRLHLMSAPAGQTYQDGNHYTCAKFTYQNGNEAEMRIPALDGWSYLFKRTESGDYHQGGVVLGIDHGKFQDLTDSNDNTLPPEMAYVIYNMFIDFHSFCNVFAESVVDDKGIQDLTRVGQKIVHSASYSEPDTNLGEAIAEGSTFKNGEVTLDFKGLSIVDDVPCAIVGFDSGDSSFTMLVKPSPDMEVKTVGASHYYGDLYVELDSRWVRKAEMGELVVAKVTMGNQKITSSTVERNTIIKALDKDAFRE